MSETPPKADILLALRKTLADELATLERVAAMSRDEAISEETRSENDFDTRATEASYLARGLAGRITSMRKLLGWFQELDVSKPLQPPVVQLGALIALEGAGDELLFMAPVGRGQVQAGRWKVNIISPSSPLGGALEELEAGDEAEVITPRGVTTREILGVW